MKLITFITVMLLACAADNLSPVPPVPLAKHACKYDLCPFKGVGNHPGEWSKAVTDYTGCEDGTDCYYIEILHLEYPDENYDQLEDRLFKWGGEPIIDSTWNNH